jgi:uncharacterized membrane protein YfcA
VSPLLLAVPFGLGIGLIVGAVGAGGAILALPVLVYILGEGVGPASTASLIVVAVAASVGASALARHGEICWWLALLFSAPAAAGSLLGAVVNTAVSGAVLVLAFIPVMLAAAGATWQRAGAGRADDDGGCPQAGLRRLATAGFSVGVLTGFFGIGGGFLVVPLLAVWLGTGFRRAVATSLVIIALTGTTALASHLVAGAAPELDLTLALAGSTAAGALVGTALNRRLPQQVLGRTFAVLVALIAVLLLVDTIALGGPPGR